MSKVYIYAACSPTVKVNGEFITITRFKSHWYAFLLESFTFTVESESESTHYEIPQLGQFAIYEKALIPIMNEYHKTLLVTDIDGTIFSHTPEGLQGYKNFISFWIRNFEFNNSILVYNTGRPISEYEDVKPYLYEPDLLVSLIGNHAYTFNEDFSESEQLDYREVLKEFAIGDWDSEAIHQMLIEKFEFFRPCEIIISPLNLIYKVPDSFVENHFKELKAFLKNKDKLIIRDLCYSCKSIATRQNLVDQHFFEVIPSSSGKNMGILYAQRKFGFTDENTMIAGDSQNDIDMFKHPVWGVLVENAEPNMKNWLRKKNRVLKYQSNLKYANAVIEALERFRI